MASKGNIKVESNSNSPKKDEKNVENVFNTVGSSVTNALALAAEIRSQGDEDGNPLSTEAVIAELKKKEKDLMRILSRIDMTLEAMDFKPKDESGEERGGEFLLLTPEEKQAKILARKKKPQPGIRIKDQLSFRGKQKIAEYVEHMDEDQDGYLIFEDFRAMKNISVDGNMTHQEEFLNIEAWKMYMNDIGVPPDEFGRVDVHKTVKYRTIIEPLQPLQKELEIRKLGYLPREQKLWSNLKQLIAESIQHRQDLIDQIFRTGSKVKPVSTGTEEDDEVNTPLDVNANLSLEEVSYILSNADQVYTRGEFLRAMLDRAAMEKLMENLQRKFLRINLQEAPEKFTNMLSQGIIKLNQLKVGIQHIKSIQIPQFMSWMFASRPLPKSEGFYKHLIKLKYGIYKHLRWWDGKFKVLYNISNHLRHRQIFKDFQPFKKADDKGARGSLKLAMKISKGEASDGLAMSWTMSSLGKLEDYLLHVRLPRDCGSAIYFDFLVRDDASDESVSKTADSIKMILSTNFAEELKKSLQFRGIFCFPCKNDDNSRVLRVALTYKRSFSIEYMFNQIYIPYSITDLIPEFSGEILTNVQLTDVFTSPSMILDLMLSAKAEINIRYQRTTILNLLERLYLSLSAGLTDEQVKVPTSVEETLMFTNAQANRKHFPGIINFTKNLYNRLTGFDRNTFKFKFTNLSDMLTKFGSTNIFIKSFFPAEIGSNAGFLCLMYEKWSKVQGAKIKDLFLYLKANLIKKEEEEEAKRRKDLMTIKKKEEKEEDSKRQEVLEKLKRLGIEMDEDDLFGDDVKDPLPYVKEIEERMRGRDIVGLICYERFHKTCLGLNTVEIICGSTRIACNFQGLDFMEVMPLPAPMEAVKIDIEALRAIRKEKQEKAKTSEVLKDFIT